MLSGYRRFIRRFIDNPRWGVQFTFGRFRPVANLIAFLHRTELVAPAPEVHSLFTAIDANKVVADMERDGLHTDVDLNAATVAEIVEFAHSTRCYWSEDPDVRFLHQDRAEVERGVGRSILLGRYFDIEDNCQAVRAVSHDPVLRYLAACYLRTKPGQTETRLWWSFASPASSIERLKADQNFHYDLHDYRSIAFFFHLTDVDEFSGPHVYVKGSHVRKPLRMLLGSTRQCSDEDMVRHYGAQNVVTLCGRPGFGFASDPFGYHKGAAPLKRDRLILRVRFTINDDGSRVDRSEAVARHR